jgi:NAD(P)-dependent dehydrogenase (short-subunit alcohol dehydrogenase family)
MGLAGARVLVVGASSGVGKAVYEALASAGAAVAGAARRPVEQPEGAIALRCDVREASDCTRVVADTVADLGGLDALVYCAGIAPLMPLVDLDQSTWLDMLSTNVVGASLVTAAAAGHLAESARGRAVYLSSHSVDRPWPGLAGYAASKAALDSLVRGWRAEHPGVCFGRVELGPTLSGFADGWQPERLRQALADWERGGYLGLQSICKPADVAAHLLAVLAADVRVEDTRILPP